MDKSGDDVANARDRLKGALQELLEHSDDSSTSSHEDSVNHEDLIRQLSKKDSSPVPAKPKSQVQKKRKKQEDQNDTGYHHAFVMKLFDRSVDLAPFSENTALYPICRAWITNKPQTSSLKSKTQTPTPEPPEVTEGKKEDDVNKETYRLPPPIKFSDEAARRKIRMPSPVRHEDTEILDINADPKAAPSRESLLEGHVKHWTAVRKKWHKYAHINEERYGKSVEILKELFKKLE